MVKDIFPNYPWQSSKFQAAAKLLRKKKPDRDPRILLNKIGTDLGVNQVLVPSESLPND